MSVIQNSNTKQVKSLIAKNIAMTNRIFLEGVHTIANPNTPRKTGELRLRVDKQITAPKTGLIQWLVPYAAYQETKTKTANSRYTTQGTGPKFAENAINGAVDRFEEYVKQGGLK